MKEITIQTVDFSNVKFNGQEIMARAHHLAKHFFRSEPTYRDNFEAALQEAWREAKMAIVCEVRGIAYHAKKALRTGMAKPFRLCL